MIHICIFRPNIDGSVLRSDVYVTAFGDDEQGTREIERIVFGTNLLYQYREVGDWQR